MMSSRKLFTIATVAAVLGASAAHAGVSAAVIEQLRDGSSSNDSSQSQTKSSSPAPASSSPAPSEAPAAARGRDSRPPPASGQRPPPVAGGRDDRGRGRDDRGRDDRGGHDYRPPPREVRVLPPRYRNYYWQGDLYYTWDGFWYRPYDGIYVGVNPPVGLFVSTLPGLSTSFYIGNTRYYYYDNTYYTYDNSRRGYVVSPSPYDNEKKDTVDQDLFVYPAQGQSEQLQADDRYACHRWAVQQTGYDPIDATYSSDKRTDYTRAITACLTGRGYSVK